MNLAQTIIAAVTVVIAAVTLWFASQSVRSARDALGHAEQMRRKANEDDGRRRIEAVAEALWDAYLLVKDGHPSTDLYWEQKRQRLDRAMVGLKDELPICGRLAESGSAAMKSDFAKALDETEEALRALAGSDSGTREGGG